MSERLNGNIKDTVSFRIGRKANNLLLLLAKREKRTKIGEMEFLAEKRCQELGISKKKVDTEFATVINRISAEVPISK